jgi:hypothetical protein
MSNRIVTIVSSMATIVRRPNTSFII